MKTYVILIPVGKGERKDLERIENEKFKSVDNALVNLPIGSLAYRISDFMDLWNDQDSDTSIEDRIDISEYWFGYVQVGE